MKRKMRRSAMATLAIVFLLSFGLVATAATLNVPGTYGTITKALAAAAPGDTILVGTDYDGTDEVFPILVQVDNLEIKANGGVIIIGEDAKAVFVVGAQKVYNAETGLYDPRTVDGVTIDGFTIADGNIGVLIKNADNVALKNLTIGTVTIDTITYPAPYEGVRIMEGSTGCLLDTVKVSETVGIGFFLENVSGNTLQNCEADSCTLGLFDFESAAGNTITGGSFTNNDNGGVVVNDSIGTTIAGATINGNTGWGVRFVFATGGSLDNSVVRDNTWGGVELIGSTFVTVDGNIVYNNGTADDDSDDAQIVITQGDKEIFRASVFDTYPGEDFENFVDIKHTVFDKLSLLEWWFSDLKIEVAELIQKTATAIGKIDSGEEPADIIGWIDTIIYEKRFICNPQTATTGAPGVLTRGFWEQSDTTDPIYEGHRPAGIESANNFTRENSTHLLRDDLEVYGGLGIDFGLTYHVGAVQTDSDEISWDKLNIMDIILTGIRREVYNEAPQIDDLKTMLVGLNNRGLITDQDLTDLSIKLEAVLGYTSQLDAIVDLLVEGFVTFDDYLELVKTALDTGNLEGARNILLIAKGALESYFVAQGISADYLDLVDIIRYKLHLVDMELPRFPEVNSDLVGKKEKPFLGITTGDPTPGDDEISYMKGLIVVGLNGDIAAEAILTAVHPERSPMNWIAADIIGTSHVTTCSTGNTISSNLISSDLLTSDRQIGIVIECDHNAIINNLITNEAIAGIDIDEETFYGEFHRLDVAMILLADECLLAYNTVEWVDNGIIRGGTWKRNDYQTEYVFEKLAEAAYWPEPGWPEAGNPGNNELCYMNPWTLLDTCYTADHFDQRPVAWVPVLSVTSEIVENVGFVESQRVVRNRISLNFFEHVGVTIDILDAESNTIDENLFYNCTNGIRFRDAGNHPWYVDFPIGGAESNIVLKHNDYYSGVAVDNQTGDAISANLDYTLPEGHMGHATVFGNVNPPMAPMPWSYDNFLTEASFDELAGWAYQRMGFTINMVQYQWDGLPPNTEFLYAGIVLPTEKPRHPDTIFDVEQPACLSQTFPAGWAIVSVPVEAVDPDPEAVFGDDVIGDLYIFEWTGEGYITPTAILPNHGYFIYLVVETTLDVCGVMPTGDQSVDFDRGLGWYMISTPTIPIPWAEILWTHEGNTEVIADCPTWVSSQYFAYNGEEYVKAGYEGDGALLDPWGGYWVRAYVEELNMFLDIPYFLANPPLPPVDSMRGRALRELSETPPPPPPVPGTGIGSVEELTVSNYPNPIRDVNTTVFSVKGALVDAVRVQIYNLSGSLVFDDTVDGWELTWHTDNMAGEFLANGVYLYVASAMVNGEWHVIETVNKLVVLR